MAETSTMHDAVCFGEILWDLLPGGAKPGGAPMNVAYHLKKLGHDPALISRVGDDTYGSDLKKILEEAGVATEFIQLDKEHSTGRVNATPNENGDMEYEIVHGVAWDYIEWEEAQVGLVREAEYFVFGSLASRSETSRSALFGLLEEANTKVLDINLRPPHFNQQRIEELLQNADILKLNDSELELISSWYGGAKDKKSRMKLLQDRFHLPAMVVTCGAEGAMVNINGEVHRHKGYKVKVADTVGSGDAFLAGFLHQLSKTEQPENVLDFACRLGALIASYHGACPNYSLSELDKFSAKTAMSNSM